jgi:cell wall-associated NlpC family hydrolase
MSTKYYENALKFEGVPYLYGGCSNKGLDCSGLVNVAMGYEKRIWATSSGNPPNHDLVKISYLSPDDFLTKLKVGDLLVWDGHVAFYAGGDRLFHAQRTGTKVGYTSDLRSYYLKSKEIPKVYRSK